MRHEIIRKIPILRLYLTISYNKPKSIAKISFIYDITLTALLQKNIFVLAESVGICVWNYWLSVLTGLTQIYFLGIGVGVAVSLHDFIISHTYNYMH